MLIIALPILALSFFGPWIFYSDTKVSSQPFACEANFSQTSYWQHNKNIPVKINANLLISFLDKENGVLVASGTVERNDNIYVLTRRVNFHTSPNQLNGMKTVTFTNEWAHTVDNTPDDIWQNYFMPEKIGTGFYANTRLLNDNTMYIKAFSSPYLICVIQR